MSIPLETSIVRIFAADGGVVGTGFLVGEMTVLTCAHVVATALAIAADVPIAPEQAISLDFPLVSSECRLRGYWHISSNPQCGGNNMGAGEHSHFSNEK